MTEKEIIGKMNDFWAQSGKSKAEMSRELGVDAGHQFHGQLCAEQAHHAGCLFRPPGEHAVGVVDRLSHHQQQLRHQREHVAG